jgi:hypothetical protein
VLTQAPLAPALAHTSSLDTDRARNAHAPTSPRSIGFCAIWDCISSSSSLWEMALEIDLKEEIGLRGLGRGAWRGSIGTALFIALALNLRG